MNKMNLIQWQGKVSFNIKKFSLNLNRWFSSTLIFLFICHYTLHHYNCLLEKEFRGLKKQIHHQKIANIYLVKKINQAKKIIIAQEKNALILKTLEDLPKQLPNGITLLQIKIFKDNLKLFGDYETLTDLHQMQKIFSSRETKLSHEKKHRRFTLLTSLS